MRVNGGRCPARRLSSLARWVGYHQSKERGTIVQAKAEKLRPGVRAGRKSPPPLPLSLSFFSLSAPFAAFCCCIFCRPSSLLIVLAATAARAFCGTEAGSEMRTSYFFNCPPSPPSRLFCFPSISPPKRCAFFKANNFFTTRLAQPVLRSEVCPCPPLAVTRVRQAVH